MLALIVIVVLLLLLFGSFPAWPHSAGWGYAPFGGVGFVLLIVLVLIILGRF